MAEYQGVYPVLYCFFDRHGGFDRAAMARQVDHCIAAGAHGIAILGLVTEVNKLDVNERLELVALVGELIDSRVPYAVTIGEPSARGQIEFAHKARQAGADWVILQPPRLPGISESDLIGFFGAVAEATELPVAIQNNPIDMDVALSVDGLVRLNRLHPNISLLKGEGCAVDIQSAIEGSGGAYRVFGGYGGIEFMALLRSGGAGLIPAPDFLAAQVRIYELWREGTPAAQALAERIHQATLPAIVFMSRSIAGMVCYGKRLVSDQIGVREIHDRFPAMQPTEFGLAELRRHARQLDDAGKLLTQAS